MKEDIDHFFELTKCCGEEFESTPASLFQGQSNRNLGSNALQLPQSSENRRNSLLQEKKDQLLHVLIAFLLYRPDVGYVQVSKRLS